MATVSSPSPLGGHGQASQHMPAAVPEDDVLNDTSPFETAALPVSSISPSVHETKQPVKKKGICACCFGGSGTKHDDAVNASGAVVSPGTPARSLQPHHSGSMKLGMRNSLRLSHRDSIKRPIFRKMGSLAYSDVDWFDAQSKFASGDHEDLMAEVDQLSRQISLQTGPWVPDPPLKFAGDGPHRFLPPPFDVSRFCGYWARDYDRSTPPPQPIHVMLKLNFFTKKVHDSIPGALIDENDKELIVLIKPTIVPPGLNRYQENFDKLQPNTTNWTLRRDLKPGSSSGRVYMMADGTVVLRIETRGLMGALDSIVEEYWRLEDEGRVLVARQCCLHVPSGKTAVQFLVGHKQPHAPKGWVV